MKQIAIYILGVLFLIPIKSAAQESDDGFSFKDLPIEYFGFVNARNGYRLSDDPYHSKGTVLGELRAQLGMEMWLPWAELKIKNDFIYDWHQEKYVNDLRELNVLFSPHSKIDIKIGRQILTWGKGDMIFVNDLFPKDWQAFFIGREIEYLKAPNNALKSTFYLPWFDLDAIYVPQFNPDRYPDGTYLSFFNPFSGGFIGDNVEPNFLVPNRWFKDDEFHLRIRKNVKGVDVAIYGNYGFWKSPAGINMTFDSITFPKMAELGFSLESNVNGGIFTSEFGYFRSLDDTEGDDFRIRNSQMVGLVGYTYDFKKDFKIGMQYYAELMLQYDSMISSLPVGQNPPDRYHDFITLRVSKMLYKQKINLSSFTYFSVTDTDIYWRLNGSYKLDDRWKIDVGANFFEGSKDNTFWSQFQNNNNLYVGVKASF